MKLTLKWFSCLNLRTEFQLFCSCTVNALCNYSYSTNMCVLYVFVILAEHVLPLCIAK